MPSCLVSIFREIFIIFFHEFAGGQDNIKLFAAPWTAPSWMKTNNFPSGDGSLIPDAEYALAA